MIGTIDVKIQAHNPNFPLEPVFTFINSAQSFRIRNVPRAVGKWNITNVFVRLAYPDNTTVQKECVLNGNIWIGTVESCAESGTSTNGFIVTASGIDENENVITNYVLGAGDLYVKDLDGTIDPERVGTKMYFNDTLPANPKKGDATFIDQTLNVYDGANWVPVAESPDPSFIIDADGNKIEADRDIIYTDNTKWSVNMGSYGTYVLSQTSIYSWEYAEPEGIEGNKKVVLSYRDGENCWFLEYYQWSFGAGTWVILAYGRDYESPSTATSLEITITGDTSIDCTLTRGAVITGKLATLSDLPTKTSDLTNDSGFITSADIPTPSYIEDTDGNRINANFSAKKSTAHKTWYVTDTRHGGNKYSLTPIDNFLSAEFFPDTPVEEESYGFRIQLVQNGEDYTGTFYDYFYVNGVWEENESWQVEFLNGETSVQCDQYFVEYSNILTDVTIATTNDLPTKTSDLTNDSKFITSDEIEPYHYSLTPTENTGLANTAYALALADSSSFKPVEDGQFSATLRANNDLTKQFRATMSFATYHPYVISKYNGQTLSSELSLYFCEDKLKYNVGTRPRTYYEGYMFRTAGAGFAIPCSEDGTPDGRLVETTAVHPSYVLMENKTTSVHSIGFSTAYADPYGNIVTIDGQSDMIFAHRTNAYKTYLFSEEIANKSELPTKTSDLTNDSGFITSADLPAKSIPFTIKQDRTLYITSQTITVKTSPTKTLTVATNPNGNNGTFVANFLISGWNDSTTLADVVTAPDTAGCYVFSTSGQLNDTWGNLKSTLISTAESFDIALPL